MKKFVLIFFALGAIKAANAQAIMPEVVNASGGYFSNVDFSFEWSIGEVSIATIESAAHMLTGGVLQPNLPGLVPNIDLSESTLQVSPNPFNSWVKLSDSSSTETQWNVRLYSANGQLLLDQRAVNELNLSYLPNGIYLLQVLSEGTNKSKSIKISKYN